MIFVPPRFAADSILEADGRRHRADHRDHRGHPGPRRAARLHAPRSATRTCGSSARTAPASSRPGKANVGIIPASFFKEGNVGVVSRSGTLTYQIGNELAQRGFGNSSIVGIGGDPVPGSSLHRHHRAVRGRPRDRADRDERRDRRRRRGARRRVHRRARDQAGRRLHRRLHRAARARRWATRARSSRARRAPRSPRPRRSRPRACASDAPRPQVAEIAVEILGAAVAG